MEKPVTLWKRILLFLAMGLLMAVTMNFATLGVQLKDLSIQQREIWAVIGFLIALLGLWGMWRIYRPFQRSHDKKMNGKEIGIGVGLFFILRILVVVFSILIEKTSGETTTVNDEMLLSLFEGLTPLLTTSYCLMIGVLGPIAEELFFRAGISDILFRGSKNLWFPMILASLFFSANHLSSNWISFAMYFSMGVVLHLAFLRRMNIKDSILVHILNNALAVLAMLLLQAGFIQ